MTALPACPGVTPCRYQPVRNGLASGGTCTVPSEGTPLGSIRACTLMAGMSMWTGGDAVSVVSFGAAFETAGSAVAFGWGAVGVAVVYAASSTPQPNPATNPSPAAATPRHGKVMPGGAG